MIENTEKVDTCQLEIQKRWTPVEGAPINRPEERTIFWCFALKFLDRERCCSAYPQAESSEEMVWLRWVGEEPFSPIGLVGSCGISRLARAAALLTAVNRVETSDRSGSSDVFR
jgi:hypothetical protein